MLLVIDSGNTNTVFAIHDGKKWRGQWRSAADPTKTADDYAVWLSTLMKQVDLSFDDINGGTISTVVPQSLFNMRNLFRRHMNVEPFVIGENAKLGVEVRIPHPEQVGADRLVNAVGAHIAHDGALLIIDSGTATTFDVIGEDGGFEGGIIAPGINLSVRALHEAAAQLPRIAIRQPEKVIGTNTIGAMQSGIFWGYVDLIDGLTRRVKSEYSGKLKVVATGGVASLFEGASKEIDIFDQDLTIRGLLEIYNRSASAT